MTNPIEGVDYFIYFQRMPYSIGGYITPNDDGTFSVYLNERLTYERNKKTIDHERKHIINGDFYNGLPIELIEGL